MLNGEARKPALFAGGLFFLSLGLVLSLCTAFGNPRSDRKVTGHALGGSSVALGLFLLVLAACSGRSSGKTQSVHSGARRRVRDIREKIHSGQSPYATIVNVVSAHQLAAPAPAPAPAPGSPPVRAMVRSSVATGRGGRSTSASKRQHAIKVHASSRDTVNMVRQRRAFTATFQDKTVEVPLDAVKAAREAIKRPGCWSFLIKCIRPKGHIAEVSLSRGDDTVSLASTCSDASSVSIFSEGVKFIPTDRLAVTIPHAVPAACPVRFCVYHIDLTKQNGSAFRPCVSSLFDGYFVFRDRERLHFCAPSASGPMPV